MKQNYQNLFEKHEILSWDKEKDSNNNEWRLNEYQQIEWKLQDTIEQLKIDRDKRMQDHQAMLDKEWEIYKLKVSEAENKARDSDQKRNT